VSRSLGDNNGKGSLLQRLVGKDPFPEHTEEKGSGIGNRNRKERVAQSHRKRSPISPLPFKEKKCKNIPHRNKKLNAKKRGNQHVNKNIRKDPGEKKEGSQREGGARKISVGGGKSSKKIKIPRSPIKVPNLGSLLKV